MRIVLLAFALALSRSAAHAQPSAVAPSCDADQSRRRICAVDDSLRDALIRADTTTLARLYADALLTTNYRGVSSTKLALLRAIGSGALRFDSLVVRERTAAVHGDTAVVAGRMHQVARGPEGAHPLEVRYVRTYVRHGAGWALIRATIQRAAT